MGERFYVSFPVVLTIYSVSCRFSAHTTRDREVLILWRNKVRSFAELGTFSAVSYGRLQRCGGHKFYLGG